MKGKFKHGGCEALVDEVPGQAALGEARSSRKACPGQGLLLNNWHQQGQLWARTQGQLWNAA